MLDKIEEIKGVRKAIIYESQVICSPYSKQDVYAIDIETGYIHRLFELPNMCMNVEKDIYRMSERYGLCVSRAGINISLFDLTKSCTCARKYVPDKRMWKCTCYYNSELYLVPYKLDSQIEHFTIGDGIINADKKLELDIPEVFTGNRIIQYSECNGIIFFLFEKLNSILKIDFNKRIVSEIALPTGMSFYDIVVVGDLCYLLCKENNRKFIKCLNIATDEIEYINKGKRDDYHKIVAIGKNILVYSRNVPPQIVLDKGESRTVLFRNNGMTSHYSCIRYNNGFVLLPFRKDSLIIIDEKYNVVKEFKTILSFAECVERHGALCEGNYHVSDLIKYIM